MRILTILGIAGLLCGCSANTDSVDDTSAAFSSSADGGADDGTPTRNACTSSFGSGLATGSHGRLDGTLVAVVPPGPGPKCNDDAHHLHLQIAMGGGVYDIAINISGVDVAEKDGAIIDGPWAEGWHAGAALDYPTSLGLHDADFTSIPETTLAPKLEAELANVNHISVFSTKYSKGGAHLVHRNGGGNDGALLLQPLTGQPHYIVFHFPNQTF